MVFLNGQFVSEAEARVSALDAGLQHGVGLFETMAARAVAGRAEVFRLAEHLARLVGSARELGLSDSLREHALAEAVGQTVERAGHERARTRLTVTGGDLHLLSRPVRSTDRAEPRSVARVDPTIMIVATAATEYPPEMFERGVRVVIADWRTNPLDPMAGHKTLNYWGRLRELQRAASAQAGEALVFQVTNHLAGGCVSNAFLVKGGTLLTPIARGEETEASGAPAPEGKVALPSPVLPGVTRGWAIDWAHERGVDVVRRMLTIDDVLGSDEVFLTNSSFGVLPVVAVEKGRIGGGEVGELTRAAREAWESETA
jgi:branched-chain amino acid aminotransferase